MRAYRERREKVKCSRGGRRTDGAWHNTGGAQQLPPLPLVSPLTSCSAIIPNAEFEVSPSAFSSGSTSAANLIKTFNFTLLISSRGS